MEVAFSYTLIPDHGRWWEISGWMRAIGAAHDPHAAMRAQFALTEVFDASWAASLPPDHEFHRHFTYYVNAVGLLDLGAALHALGPGDHVVEDLKRKGHHLNIAFQLWTGHLLASSGASLSADDGCNARRTPDWVATWPTGSVVLEAKRMGRSAWARARDRVDTWLFQAFQQRWLELAAVAPTGVWSEVQASEAVIEAASSTAGPPYAADRETAWSAGRQLAEEVAASLARSDQPGKRGLPHGYLLVREGRSGEARMPILQGHQPDLGHEARRAKSRLDEALEQGAGHDAPVLFATEVGGFDSTSVRCRAFQHCLEHDPPNGVERLAGVLIRDGVHHVEEALPYSIMRVIPGPAYFDVPLDFFEAFEVCETGHAHFEPLRSQRRYACRPGDW